MNTIVGRHSLWSPVTESLGLNSINKDWQVIIGCVFPEIQGVLRHTRTNNVPNCLSLFYFIIVYPKKWLYTQKKLPGSQSRSFSVGDNKICAKNLIEEPPKHLNSRLNVLLLLVLVRYHENKYLAICLHDCLLSLISNLAKISKGTLIPLTNRPPFFTFTCDSNSNIT